jgi:simple sugar transport system substrate-binding protein
MKVIFLLLTLLLFSCEKRSASDASGKTEEQIILGFSQIGAESAWRECNSQSVRTAAAAANVSLLFTNAEQKQENQIKAIRSFIAYQVDVIAFVPIVATGWDHVLMEAKSAGIPVLVTDRKIVIEDESLYAGFIGTDSEQEGRGSGEFLIRKFADKIEQNQPVRIVEFLGTEGSSVANGRAKGFREALQDYPQFEIVFSQSGDFLRSKGYELMKNLLADTGPDFDVLFSHNDGMTLGAIDALKEKNVACGTDVVIVTIDAEQAAIDALQRGEVNCVIECNPKMGPQIVDLAQRLVKSETIPRNIHVDETVFYEWDDLSNLPPRGY